MAREIVNAFDDAEIQDAVLNLLKMIKTKKGVTKFDRDIARLERDKAARPTRI